MKDRYIQHKALLIQPPNWRAIEIPYGTIPTLTAALRSKGYTTIPKDLNIDILLKLLDPETLNKLHERLERKIEIIYKRKSGQKNSIIHSLKKTIAGNISLLPFIQKFYLLYISRELREKDKSYYQLAESKRKLDFIKKTIPEATDIRNLLVKQAKEGRLTVEIHRKLHLIYKECLDAINLLATPLKKPESYFKRIDDTISNFYYLLYDEFIKSFIWEEIQFVGITISKETIIEALTLAKMIKAQFPKVYLTLGGELFRHVDFEDKEDIKDLKILLSSYADSIVIYEGDTAIVKIMECLNGTNTWEKVPNLIRLVNNGLVINEPFHLENIDDLPPMDFEGLPVEFYPGFPLEISRGCYWSKCSFCRFCLFSEHKDKFTPERTFYRRVKIEKIISQVTNLITKYNKSNFEFVCLDISPKEAKQLSLAIIDANLKINWGARVRLDKTFEPELFDLLAKAGVYFYSLFPETFSQRTADLHNKNYNIDHIKSLINYWEKNKDKLPLLVLKVFTAFPGEKLKDFKETYKYFLNSSFGVQNVGRFKLTKHSDVYYHPEKYGIKIIKKRNNNTLFEHFKSEWNNTNSKERRKIESFLIIHQKTIKNKIVYWKEKWKLIFLEE